MMLQLRLMAEMWEEMILAEDWKDDLVKVEIKKVEEKRQEELGELVLEERGRWAPCWFQKQS